MNKIIINNADFDKTVIIIGVFHGDEEGGEYLINEYLKRLPLNTKNRLIFIPRLNEAKTRVNKNGVDLNRNFPTKNWEYSKKNEYYGGPSPRSEIETQELISLIDLYLPNAVLTIHAPYKVVNYDGPAYELAYEVSKITGYPVQEDIGYPCPGSFGNYMGAERNIPTITLEIDDKVLVSSLSKKFNVLFDYLAYEF